MAALTSSGSLRATLILAAVLDSVGKGVSGATVQNLDLLLGR